MDATQLSYKQSEAGKVYRFISSGSDSGMNLSQSFTLTGYYRIYAGGVWYQTTSGGWANGSDIMPTGETAASQSVENAQVVVDVVIDNNKQIYQNNLFCARFANHLTAEEKQDVRDLQARLVERDSALRKNGGLTSEQESTPPGYINLLSYLDNLCGGNSGKTGVVITATAMIIIVAVVLASLATAVYFGFKAYAAESVDDVKFSNELTETLMKRLTPDEYKQLEKETSDLLTKERLKNDLKNGGSFSSTLQAGGNLLKWAVIAVGVGYLLKMIKERKIG